MKLSVVCSLNLAFSKGNYINYNIIKVYEVFFSDCKLIIATSSKLKYPPPLYISPSPHPLHKQVSPLPPQPPGIVSKQVD